MQALAIEWLAKWQEPAVLAHKQQLLALVKGKTFRETLTLFSLDHESGALAREHRPVLLPLLSRALFSKLTQRSGRGASKNNMASRRATIFAFFGGARDTNMRPD